MTLRMNKFDLESFNDRHKNTSKYNVFSMFIFTDSTLGPETIENFNLGRTLVYTGYPRFNDWNKIPCEIIQDYDDSMLDLESEYNTIVFDYVKFPKGVESKFYKLFKMQSKYQKSIIVISDNPGCLNCVNPAMTSLLDLVMFRCKLSYAYGVYNGLVTGLSENTFRRLCDQFKKHDYFVVLNQIGKLDVLEYFDIGKGESRGYFLNTYISSFMRMFSWK